MKMGMDISWREWLPLLVICGLSILYMLGFYHLDGPPFEDAAMIMRYAENLSAGHGIVWNPGEPPVDGATDFLFMVSVAALHKLGLSPEFAVRLLTLSAHLLTIALVYFSVLRLHQLHLVWAILTAAYLAIGPALVYIEAYFGTPFFALFVALAYWSYLQHMQRSFVRWSDAVLLAGAALLAGLTRPEGVLMALFLYAPLLILFGWKHMWRTTAMFLLLFGTIGLGYFLWHWSYFGHPLPNPFYIKGGGIHLSSLKASVLNTALMALPFIPVFLIAPFLLLGQWRETILYTAPAIAFVLMWLLLSNAMNYGMRFQYAALPVLLMAWPPLLKSTLDAWKLYPHRIATVAVLGLSMLAFQHYNYGRGLRMPPDGRVALGEALEKYAEKGYTMAVTEAGNLPYFSKWRAIDTWGLNDARIAHSGGVGTALLDEYKPELFLIHDYWSPGTDRIEPPGPWTEMCDSLFGYLAIRNYELVACYGDQPRSTHFYFLRRDFPDFKTVRELVLEPYSWYETGDPATNFLRRGD